MISTSSNKIDEIVAPDEIETYVSICEKPDGERHRLSLLLTQLCTTGLQRLGKPFP